MNIRALSFGLILSIVTPAIAGEFEKPFFLSLAGDWDGSGTFTAGGKSVPISPARVRAERKDGKFVFSDKWPTSARDAHAGLLVRESEDKRWTMGIAWESFISAQGHNPWKCMHLSIRVGPLKKGQKKTIRGRIYLLQGSKEDCLKKFKRDF